MKTTYSFQMLVATLLLTVISSYGSSKNAFVSKNGSSTLLANSFPSSLSNFEYEINLGPSTNQTFSINDGTFLNRSYTVTAPVGYEVSTSSSSGFSNLIVIPGSVIDLGAVTVFIRLSSSLSIGIYNGSLTITASGVNEIIELYGEVTRRQTTWDGSAWNNGTPDIESIAIINNNYSTTSHGNFSAWALDISSTYQLTINDNTYIEVENDVVIDGTLQVESTGSFVQNNNSGTFTINNGGSASVVKNTSLLKSWHDYTYWSSPVNGTNVNSAFSSSHPNYRFWFNAQNYLDILRETENGNSYVSGHDDIDDNGDDWTLLNGSDNLTPGVGYAASHSPSGFVSGYSYQYTFSGPFNTGNITTPIYYNGDNGDNDWNFIGNPYPSAISVDTFFTENGSVVGDAIYLWSHANPPSSSNNGNEVLNYSTNDYAIINAGSGEIAGGSRVIPNRYIPSCQGFFIQGKTNGNVTFNNDMRMKDNTSNSQFFRQNTNTLANKLWLDLTSDNGVFNQILVAYVDGATDNNDGSAYDSPRFLSSDTAAIIYTTIGNEAETKYAIQGKHTSSLNTEEVIGIGFYTSITDATVYTFSIPKKQGDFMTSHPIFIKDNLLNITHNLIESDYSFSSSTGIFNNRFEIVFTTETLNINEEFFYDSIVIKEVSDTKIKFSSKVIASKIKNIELYNIQGKSVYNIPVNNTESILNIYNLKIGTYIAKVELDNGTIINKKMVKRL
ncbi:T9SS type A sorting domain-containing protein [uncultured Winogradskyella sp.]|uniref:T9SS type A sorting domain-containing protein n=1 Tax=uncultured Winogradskyella sp. TaxID=395353 RepID=UPI0026083553|nr:T9SS type A sorting domain-containing protein [uncultured Winogradskyella sp.]